MRAKINKRESNRKDDRKTASLLGMGGAVSSVSEGKKEPSIFPETRGVNSCTLPFLDSSKSQFEVCDHNFK